MILSARVTRGAGGNSRQSRPAVRAACRRCRPDTLPGDTAYDSEPNHAYARGTPRIRETFSR